ncbi:terminase small subunit [Lactiplantibacillus sp. WILCCON 0030]|uniref:Terminase small subunit n=1 Tax=Lactiplantibacillus brownii TaxID=3069269 RepID=A0ABU1A825_9LACO|nr:terminase small subunit [Lactiplantibacillus brownii]MDQ7937090.1 terminase small subunit [Lactiplantibacillus brownii]
MDKREQAGKDYIAGMKYKDISAKYGVPVGTLKSWRARDHWEKDATATQKVQPKVKKDAPKVAPKIVEELEANNELTEKQKLFCLFYLQRFNATWAYQQAYKSSYEVALTNGPRMLGNARIKLQLAELKKQQSTDLYFDIQDIINELRQISRADARDVVDFKTVKRLSWYKVRDKVGPYEDSNGHFRWEPKIDPETGEQAFYYENIVKLHDSNEIDTSNIKSIRIDKGEAVVEMYDKYKALDSLAKYADIYTTVRDSQGVQIKDDIEGDDGDDDSGETKE